MPEFTFTGTFTVEAKDESDARSKLNKCFRTSKQRLEGLKARYTIELKTENPASGQASGVSSGDQAAQRPV
jgi:hypothetical protein